MTGRIATSISAVRRLFVRLLVAFTLSTGCLFALLWLFEAQPALEGFGFFGLPLSVLVGLVPLVYWYRRDAYPIGLFYCPAAFFLLRAIGTRVFF